MHHLVEVEILLLGEAVVEADAVDDFSAVDDVDAVVAGVHALVGGIRPDANAVDATEEVAKDLTQAGPSVLVLGRVAVALELAVAQKCLCQAGNEQKGLRWKSWTKRGPGTIRMYSAEQRAKAIEAFAGFGRSESDTIAELGCPNRGTFCYWWREHRLSGGEFPERRHRGPRCSGEEKQGAAVRCLEHEKSLARTTRAMGRPSRSDDCSNFAT